MAEKAGVNPKASNHWLRPSHFENWYETERLSA